MYQSRGSKQWNRQQRTEVLEKTQGRCAYCGTVLDPATLSSWHVDHVVPKFREGTDQLDNLVASCAECNTTKKIKSVEGFRHWLTTRQAIAIHQIIERISVHAGCNEGALRPVIEKLQDAASMLGEVRIAFYADDTEAFPEAEPVSTWRRRVSRGGRYGQRQLDQLG